MTFDADGDILTTANGNGAGGFPQGDIMLQQALVVVDMQNDFVTGVLGTEEARAIVPIIADKVRAYHKAGLPVYFTRDTHYSDTYETTSEGIHLPVLHCVAGSDGWQLVPELEIVRFERDTVIDKTTFGSKRLADAIGRDPAVRIEVCGVCTGICVISNVVLLKTHMPNLEVYIDSKACACVTPEANEAALAVLRNLQCNVA